MKKSHKILIIDDDSRNIFALNAVLKSRDYICSSALGAREGLQMLEEDHSIGLVLMDMMMPDMDGYEAIQKIKKHPRLKDIPVIAVTAQAMGGDRDQCLKAGAVAYISKPVNIEELVKEIQLLIG